jgi:hypothetical protein
MDLKVGLTGWEGVDWLYVAQDRDSDKWRAVMNTVHPMIRRTLK